MRWLAFVALVLASLQLSASSARAQSAAERRRDWYGWQNLAVDGAALAAVITAIALENAEVGNGDANAWLGVSGAIAFTLGSPIVDWWHRNVGLGWGSLGLRIVADGLFMVGMAAHVLGCEDEDEEGLPCSDGQGWYVGSALIAIIAVALDSGLDREPATSRDASPPIALSMRHDGVLLSWRGSL